MRSCLAWMFAYKPGLVAIIYFLIGCKFTLLLVPIQLRSMIDPRNLSASGFQGPDLDVAWAGNSQLLLIRVADV
jgi:hypothetical protein